MSIRAYLFLAAFAVLVTLLVTMAAYAYLRARKASAQTWESLFNRLVAVDRYKVALVATWVLDEDGSSVGPDPEPGEIWDLIGGMQGLVALGANCDVLIDLACYVQGTYPEALAVAEQLRLNAREIQWHVSRLRHATQAESLHAAFPQYAQRAVATYYGMTQRVLALYATADFPEHALLKQTM